MKFSLSRRAMLKGAGVTMGLPLLEAMLPRRAFAAGEKPLRFVVVFAPHGMHMPGWTPKQTGSGYALTPILQPMAGLQGDFNVVSGLANYPASITTKEFAGSHARGAGALLTQSPLRFTASKDIQNGISLDQVIANHIKSQTRLPSLELGVVSGSATGNCEDGYSCAYLHNISWNSPTTFMPKETKPRALFDRLFTGGLTNPSPAPSPAAPTPVDTKALRYRKSVLDLVSEETKRLSRRLGSRDRAKMDEYLTSVGELQRRLDEFEKQNTAPKPVAAACTPGTPPSDAKPESYEQHLKLISDLIVLAFQCDTTRVVTFMQEDPFNSRSFSFLGVSGNHHDISHHGGDSKKTSAQQTINTFEVTQFAYLVDRLKQVQEAEGESLLYNSIVLFTSEFGDGDDHYHWDLPMLVAGNAGGRFATGRHIAYPHRGKGGPANKEDMPMANLFLNVLAAYGIETPTFGTTGSEPYGTKPLAELAG